MRLTPLTQAERAEMEAWLAEHRASLPASVRAALEQHGALCEGLSGGQYKLSQVLAELRRALGITASSERRRASGEALGPVTNGDGARAKSERERLELDAARIETLSAWHKKLAKRHRKRLKAIRRKLMKTPVDLELGEDERSGEEKAADASMSSRA